MKTASPSRNAPNAETTNAPIPPSAPPSNVYHLNVVSTEPAEPEEQRPKFSFDITQPDARGFVLIDACVPMSLAVEFMNLLTTYNID